MRQLIIDSLMMVITLSAIPMIVIAVLSGCVALIQAATQAQEPSVVHLVKLIAFVVVVLFIGDWAGAEVSSLFERSLRALETVARETTR